MRPAKLTGWIARATLATLFAWSGFWTERLAIADHRSRQETLEGTRQAAALMPGRAEYHVRMAKLLTDSDPDGARAALRRALALNPSDALSWIDLGLSFEAIGDYRQAEACLLRAAAVDRQYLPRWTLANWYFRRGDLRNFWPWAQSAAAMIYDDPTPLFRLCGMVVEDGNLIDRLAIRKPGLRLQYLQYLVDRDALDRTGPSMRAVLESGGEGAVPALLALSGRLLDRGRVSEALAIWNALAAAHRIPEEALDPAVGRVLTNGSFAVIPEPHGFDWRMPGIEGVTAAHEENPAGLRLTFSGRQPGTCRPLMQILPVEDAAAYAVTVRYRTSSIPPDSGLRWRVSEPGGALLAETPVAPSPEAGEAAVKFRVPKGSRMVHLALEYERQPGTVRFEGSLLLYEVRVNREVIPKAGGLLM